MLEQIITIWEQIKKYTMVCPMMNISNRSVNIAVERFFNSVVLQYTWISLIEC